MSENRRSALLTGMNWPDRSQIHSAAGERDDGDVESNAQAEITAKRRADQPARLRRKTKNSTPRRAAAIEARPAARSEASQSPAAVERADQGPAITSLTRR